MDKKVYKFISKEILEEIVKWDICKWCWDEFAIFKLQEKIEEKMKVNFKQDLCPDCMMRRFLMMRSETSLYKDKCYKCKKDIISMYAPEVEEIVYCNDCYNNSDFIIKDDFVAKKETVEDDFYKLWEKTPKKALISENNENSKYANYTWNSKNIYMSYLTYTNSQNILYSYYSTSSSDCIDCHNIKNCEKCYECINTIYSFNCYYSYNLVNSSFIYFSINLESCQNCIFSSNLVNKKYYIYNKKYPKQEYEKILKSFKNNLKSNIWLRKLKQEYKKLEKKTVYKNLQKVNTQKSVWNFISNTKNTILAFYSNKVEDAVNVWWWTIKDSVNFIWWANIESSYNSCLVGFDSQRVIWSFNVFYSSFVNHSIWIYNSSNILFSVWLRNKEYAILNRKYSKEDYKKYFKEIIDFLKQKWDFWKFFDAKFVKIPYNDSASMDFYPIEKIVYQDGKEKIINKKWKWIVKVFDKDSFISKASLNFWWKESIDIFWRNFEKEVDIPKNISLIKASNLPDKIENLSFQKEILQSAIICEESKRPFRIMKYELEFYIKNNLPLPRLHPKIRHTNRTKKILPRKLYIINCNKCKIKILSSYNKQSKKTIYCEKCYNKIYL